jgi:hypothetical protein
MHAALAAVDQKDTAVLRRADIIHAVQCDALQILRRDGSGQPESRGRGLDVAVEIIGIALIDIAAAVSGQRQNRKQTQAEEE